MPRLDEKHIHFLKTDLERIDHSTCAHCVGDTTVLIQTTTGNQNQRSPMYLVNSPICRDCEDPQKSIALQIPILCQKSIALQIPIPA